MNNKKFIALILLVCFSLIGIMIIQGYWIGTAIKDRKDQFDQNVFYAMRSIAQTLQEREIKNIFSTYPGLEDAIKQQKITETEMTYMGLAEDKKSSIFLTQKVYQGDVTLPLNSYSSSSDSIRLQPRFIYSNILGIKANENFRRRHPNIKISYGSPEDDLTLDMLSTQLNVTGSLTPIEQRIDTDTLRGIIMRELLSRELDTNYQFAVFNRGEITSVVSSGFENGKNAFHNPIFPGDNRSDYQLVLEFPNRGRYIFGAMSGMIAVSILFILGIVFTFGFTIYYLLKQKRISEIKNDFINNMTHEFKTPIATINIAVDSLRSPRIIENKERVLHYADIIKEENRRMLGQVESVLEIAKLQRRNLQLNREETDLNGLFIEALDHVSLMVENRGGTIDVTLCSGSVYADVDRMHLENSIINILDNANKYSPEKPHITVSTKVKNNRWILTISDQGIGISKSKQKEIFEKFYRVPTGNLHEVKGHGLGLAYAKSIVEMHSGELYVQSEKGHGSTFIMEIPIKKYDY